MQQFLGSKIFQPLVSDKSAPLELNNPNFEVFLNSGNMSYLWLLTHANTWRSRQKHSSRIGKKFEKTLEILEKIFNMYVVNQEEHSKRAESGLFNIDI